MSIEWRKIQARNVTDWKELAEFVELDLQPIIRSPRTFPLNLPRRLAEKIEKGNVEDPILRQFVPLRIEEKRNPLFREDPVGDMSAQKTPKMLHKYFGRALLLATGACAMHCRFCFRQHFAYARSSGFEKELMYVRGDPTISELILSGGDPLSLGDDALRELMAQLATIPHLKRLRWHTRFPIGIPERITESFLSLFESTRLQNVFVLHCNHPKELDADIFFALKRILKCGVPVLTSTVLLSGVNDNTSTLHSLFETVVDHGIIPYCLSQLDRVQGGQHFEVAIEKGVQIMEELRKSLPGYAIPKYIQEIAGEKCKTLIPHR